MKSNSSFKFLNQHLFHLVDASPWPFLGSCGGFFLTLNLVAYMHGFLYGGLLVLVSLVYILIIMFAWWRDVIREATFQGHHTLKVQQGLKYGVILFIVSEIMLFFAFFWAFFHSSLVPTIEIGCVWPPVGLNTFSPWGVPLLNTLILLLSGISVTWAHHAILLGNYIQVIFSLILTVSLAILFTNLQICEYLEAEFSLSDGIYGSVFYLTTGLHGFHVLVGTLFLIVCLIRVYLGHFSRSHHLGFEAAIWYWHFVDVVWLGLFLIIYWWGNASPNFEQFNFCRYGLVERCDS